MTPASSRLIERSWQGTPVTVGLDECDADPEVLRLPALGSTSTRGEMEPLMRQLAGT